VTFEQTYLDVCNPRLEDFAAVPCAASQGDVLREPEPLVELATDPSIELANSWLDDPRCSRCLCFLNDGWGVRLLRDVWHGVAATTRNQVSTASGASLSRIVHEYARRMIKIIAPPDGAAEALGKKTHWRVYKKPPTVEGLASEPVGVLLTSLASTTTRMVVIKVGDHRWLSLQGEGYGSCVEQWRAAAAKSAPKLIDDAVLTKVLAKAIYSWSINRMYTDAGTLPPNKPAKADAKPSKPKSRRQSR